MLSKSERVAVFLDRDGVINQSVVVNGKPYPPENVASMVILPGVFEALTALKQAGFILIVVTNQPDVATGVTTAETVEAIHQYMVEHLPIDAFRTCFHIDAHDCHCRKPKPGALLQAAEDYQINLSASYMIGDRWRDVEAGQNAGCKTIFIDYGYTEKQPQNMNFTVQSLKEAAHIILGEMK